MSQLTQSEYLGTAYGIQEGVEADGDLGAPAYLYAGPASYVSHTGDRPMRIIWKLDHELPADVFHSARVAAG